MSQTIIIEYINFSGETAVILFTPFEEVDVINIGEVILPYEFNPSLLNPPKDIYGYYTILTSGGTCSNILNIIPPTPNVTQSPTKTPTNTLTPTNTITNTKTPTKTACPTVTPNASPTVTPSNTKTNTPTSTLCPTQTPTTTPKSTLTPTKTPTNTKTSTLTPTNTKTQTKTPTKTSTNTPTNTPTRTETPTNTQTNTPTKTQTKTNTKTPTNTPTNTNTPTTEIIISPTPTRTLRPTRTPTPTKTQTTTQTPTSTSTPTQTKTQTSTPTQTKTQTSTPTQTKTQTSTKTSTPTQTKTQTSTKTQTPTPTQTNTPTETQPGSYSASPVCGDFIIVGDENRGTRNYLLDVGSQVGVVTINFNSGNVPDRYYIYYDGNLIQDTGFRGDPFFNLALINLGYSPVSGPGNGSVNFQKTTSSPTYIEIVVVSPLEPVDFSLYVNCPSLTPSQTPTQTNTPTRTKTPSQTKTSTPTKSSSSTPTPSQTQTITSTPTKTLTPTVTKTKTPTKTSTPTQTPSSTPSVNFTGTSNCNDKIIGSSSNLGSYTYIISVGSEIGPINLTINSYSSPVKFELYWDSNLVIDTGFIGNPLYNNILNGLGYPDVVGSGLYSYTFNKTNTTPTDVILVITVPILGSEWIATVDCPVVTPTPTPTKTQTKTPTKTSTNTPTNTSTLTQTSTQTPTNTTTPTNTPSNRPTLTPTKTQTSTQTPTRTQTKTSTQTSTQTQTSTPTQTTTQTSTNTPTQTQTPTQTRTSTPTPTDPPPSPPPTLTPTKTPTNTPSQTQTSTQTPTQTQTSTQTPTETKTSTPTPTETKTSTPTPTQTRTPDVSPPSTQTPTPTNTKTQTQTPTNTPTQTQTPTNTPTQTQTPTNTPTQTQTPTGTQTQTPTKTKTQTPTKTKTQTPTQTPSSSPPNTPVCFYDCIIIFNTDTDLFVYDFTANTSYNITPTLGWFDSYDVAHYWNPSLNLGKLWIYRKPQQGYDFFREYEITSICPWVFNPTYGGAVPYRDIPYPAGITTLGNGLTYAKTIGLVNYLIGSIPGIPNKMVQFAINSTVFPYSSSYSELFDISSTLTSPDIVYGDVILTSSSATGGQKIIFTKYDNFPGISYLTQYSYTGTPFFELDTSPIGQNSPPLPTNNINKPEGIFQWGGLFYVIQSDTGDVYNVLGDIPYSRTLVGNVGQTNVRGASQTINCLGNNLSGSTPFFRYQTRPNYIPSGNQYLSMTLVGSGNKEMLVNYGDAIPTIVTLPSPPTLSVANEIFTYLPNNVVYTATTYGFKLNGMFTPLVFADSAFSFTFKGISGILAGDEDPYTFATFPGITSFSFQACSFANLNGVETTNSLRRLQFSGHVNSEFELNTFNLGTKTNLESLEIINCDLTGFSHDLTSILLNGGTKAIYFINNTQLVQLDIECPLTITNRFTVAGPNNFCNLTSINSVTGFENLTGLTRIDVNRNKLTGWTYNLPYTLTWFNASQNARVPSSGFYTQFGLTEFDIDLTNNQNLRQLYLNDNRISSFTETIINCTSLLELELQANQLLSIPELPNSIQILKVSFNYLTSPGFINLPTGLITFECTNNNNLTYFDTDITSLSVLSTFNMSTCSLTGWTQQFPINVDTITFTNNVIVDFDFSLVNGVSAIYLNINDLSGCTNLSSNSTIITLDLAKNAFKNINNIIPTTFPSSLVTLDLSNQDPTGFLGNTWSSNVFAGCTNIKNVTIQKSGLNSTTVDNIIIWISQVTNQINGTITLDNNAGIGTNNSPRTTNSDSAVIYLNNLNWTITTAP